MRREALARIVMHAFQGANNLNTSGAFALSATPALFEKSMFR